MRSVKRRQMLGLLGGAMTAGLGVSAMGLAAGKAESSAARSMAMGTASAKRLRVSSSEIRFERISYTSSMGLMTARSR